MKNLKIKNGRRKSKTTRVIIVRHGETVGNKEGGFQGRTDSALTPKGERQAFLAAQRLKDQNITKIYSSPLSRAIKTAEIIRGTHDIEILTDDRLLEIDCGEWEGKSYDEANEMFPESMYKWEKEPHKHVMPGGESISQVLERVSEVFTEIVSDNSGNTVLIVSHCVLIMRLMAHYEGEKLEDFWKKGKQGNAAINIVEVSQNGEVSILLSGDCSHLTD